MKTHEKDRLLDTKVSYVSGSKMNVPTFKMSLCDEPDVLEDSKSFQMDKNSFSEVQMEENFTDDDEEISENTNFLHCRASKSRNSVFSRYSEISFRNFRHDYQYIFVLASFLIFFITGFFFGSIFVKLFMCEKGKVILRDLNETITLAQQFDMML